MEASTASVVIRQQNLKKLMEQLQSIRLSIQSDPFLKSLCEHEHNSLQNTVSTALSLYNMFERKNALHSEHTAMGFFGLLPDELFMHVLSFLPPTTLCFSRRVCHKWRVLSKDPSLWKTVCETLKFTQPLTVTMPWEWVFRSKQAKLTSFGGKLVGRADTEQGTYEGEWEDGKRCGFGIFVGTTRYEGEWKNDKCHGKGECRFPNGAIYRGDYEEGLQHGQGKKTWANGSIYTGSWVNGHQHGFGVLQWLDGERYEGEWEQGFQSGKGTYLWPDGDSYVGSWRRDLLHGFGLHRWHDGCSYAGDWHDGKRHGEGEYRWPDAAVYKGSFHDSYRHGPGEMRWADGSGYSGEWRNDSRVGASPERRCNRPWDGFFHKNYEQQRAYVKEVMRPDAHRQLAARV
jgi:hypothetical protein